MPILSVFPCGSRIAAAFAVVSSAAVSSAAVSFAAVVITGDAFAQTQVSVKDAWVRATVPGQKASSAFMELTASADGRLVAVSTPAAGTAQIHTMSMDGNVMKMHAVDGVALPAGKSVPLTPGGNHIMLLDLKRPLKEGEHLPLTLTVEAADHSRQSVEVDAPVRPLTAMSAH